MLEILDLKEGLSLIKYLGILLSVTYIRRNKFNILIDKILEHFEG